MRKAQDDAMARTQAERDLGELLTSASSEEDFERAQQVARETLGAFPAVEFERGTGRTPDGQKIEQRRVVITGPWVVDPEAALGGMAGSGKSVSPNE